MISEKENTTDRVATNENSDEQKDIALKALLSETQTKKQARIKMSAEQVKYLEIKFNEDSKPSASTKRNISEKLGIPVKNVQIWFQNHRAKTKALNNELRKKYASDSQNNQFRRQQDTHSYPSQNGNFYQNPQFYYKHLEQQNKTYPFFMPSPSSSQIPSSYSNDVNIHNHQGFMLPPDEFYCQNEFYNPIYCNNMNSQHFSSQNIPPQLMNYTAPQNFPGSASDNIHCNSSEHQQQSSSFYNNMFTTHNNDHLGAQYKSKSRSHYLFSKNTKMLDDVKEDPHQQLFSPSESKKSQNLFKNAQDELFEIFGEADDKKPFQERE